MNSNYQPVICIAGHRFYTEKHGGVELQTRYIGEALADAGWKVAFLSPSLNGKVGKEELNENTHVWWYPHFSFSFQAPKKLINKFLDSIQPSVVYQRGRGQLTNNNLILRYAHQKAIPYVFALSSDMDLDGFYEIKTTIKAYKPLWKRIMLIPYALWLDKAMRSILRQADYLVAQHEGQLHRIKDKLHTEPNILRTIHPKLNHVASKSNEKIVLWANNYKPIKQGELFVRLASQCKKLNCRFIMIYGKTKEEYIRPVLKEASGLDNLILLGEISYEEAEDFIEKASVFVNTSIFEGFPNTFVQSWLRETPTISLNVDPGGVIKREKIGICSGNFEQLVKDVKHLIENDQGRIDIGKRARAYAEEVHGFEHNAGKIADFFSNIIDIH
jgi:glycosyltransferase involved in cell wall biosynthesis